MLSLPTSSRTFSSLSISFFGVDAAGIESVPSLDCNLVAPGPGICFPCGHVKNYS